MMPHDPRAAAEVRPNAEVNPKNEVGERDEEKPRKGPVMSRAARRRAKKPPVTVTSEMREAARERLRELRRHLRMLKSNGARRKLAKVQAKKRGRETTAAEEACGHLSEDARPLKKQRRE
ncbi:hypothetical protein TRSC58_02458 [Trypanosoma rangeli SC58]|uniref:Uncharacterized protein n=1 Tax=Trypanosoma rangeli SC58 TaxID=429131 RepID=A0A061J948_TRYRA|nr:hypothetical protein TRSC58_02458 [Trypanosoma rangeli SC58]